MITEGTFITFEGIEGCGKTTQLRRLAGALANRGIPFLTTLEPGEGPIGRRIRETLLAHHGEPIDPLAELMLYLADRAQHVTRVLAPGLEAGKVVLCDRYADATLAYQGYGRGIDPARIRDLNVFVTRGLTPSLTFLFDCPPEVGLRRIRGAPDRMESQELDFHRRVRAGYLSLAEAEPGRFAVIDATRSAESVFDEMMEILNARGMLGGR